jgi:hypothetical protein
VSSTVRDVDRGAAALAERLRNLAAADEKGVRVGILSESNESLGDIDLVELALIHEFGAPDARYPIPERSFIRATVDESQAEIAGVIRAQAKLYYRGAVTREAALDRVGAFVAGLCQKRIAARIDPPNAPATIEGKGSDVPLIDTGALRAAITWNVEGDT